MAGLGIGGMAVALAAQDTLSGIFASMAIFLEKPFMVGDFVDLQGVQARSPTWASDRPES